MSDVPPIGLPNLISQGDLLARARSAQAGSERAGNDQVAAELRRLADRRAEQVQRAERVEATGRHRREDRHPEETPHEHYDDEPDADEDDGHRLDVTA
jgi:hypothetical protein